MVKKLGLVAFIVATLGFSRSTPCGVAYESTPKGDNKGIVVRYDTAYEPLPVSISTAIEVTVRQETQIVLETAILAALQKLYTDVVDEDTGVYVRQKTGETIAIAGTVASNAGTGWATSGLAKESGGNLATIAGKDFSTSAKQDTGNSSLSTIAGKDFATSAKQDTANGYLSSMDTKLSALTNLDTSVNSVAHGIIEKLAAILVDTVKVDTSLESAFHGVIEKLDAALGTLSKESGGNLATIKTNLDQLVTASGGGYIRQDSTATIAKESGGNLATLKTNTDPLVTAGGGGYIRQDSTGTIAKETGGNLATIAGAVSGSKMMVDGGNSNAVKVDGSATTQPVSIASMPSTPVTGTFWQTTQPVSLSDDTPTESTHTVMMTSAGTEYSFVTPANTVFWAMRPRNAASFRYSTASGGTTAGSYQTLKAGEIKTAPTRGFATHGSKTLYFQEPANSSVYMEVEVWTK